jgi:hypothetical protein
MEELYLLKMRTIEPTGAFKILGGNLVLHFGLFLGLLILSNSKHIVHDHNCDEEETKQLVHVLIVAHGVSAVTSFFHELATLRR